MFNLNQSPASILGFAILTGFFLTFAMRVFGWLGNAKHRYPPGPNGIPFFGNIFRLSKADFEELGKKYGRRLVLYQISMLTTLLRAKVISRIWRRLAKGYYC
jgi:hypothetical protein